MLWPALPVLANDQGWDYLIEKLVTDGVERERVVAAFRDPRVAPFVELGSPPGHRANRARCTAASSTRRRGRRAPVSCPLCGGLRAGGADTRGARRGAGGDSLHRKRVRPQHRIVRRVLTVWPGWRWHEPENLHRNIQRLADDEGWVDPHAEARLRERARYLERTFYPEVRAMFPVADRLGVAPLDILGSGAGAFGAPQFLPTSYLAYGVDADGDGRVSLTMRRMRPPRARATSPRMAGMPVCPPRQRRRRGLAVHRSTAYVDTVLALAARIGKPPSAHQARPTSHKPPPATPPAAAEASDGRLIGSRLSTTGDE